MNYIPTLFARLREEYGPELHLLHDVHHRLTPIEAAEWESRWNRITFSGWKIRRRRNCKKASV